MIGMTLKYKNTSFGIVVTLEEAKKVIEVFYNGDEEVIEIEGYGIYPKEAIKLEFERV